MNRGMRREHKTSAKFSEEPGWRVVALYCNGEKGRSYHGGIFK